jgi:hypothetical protein
MAVIYHGKEFYNIGPRTLRPAHTAISYMDIWRGAYSISPTIPVKLGCPIQKKKKK